MGEAPARDPEPLLRLLQDPRAVRNRLPTGSSDLSRLRQPWQPGVPGFGRELRPSPGSPHAAGKLSLADKGPGLAGKRSNENGLHSGQREVRA